MARIAAFEPLSKFILKISRNVRQLMFYNGILCIVGNAALADEMAQIVTVGPIIKDLVKKTLKLQKKICINLSLETQLSEMLWEYSDPN